MAVDDKFALNRNKFRRVYSFGGRPAPNNQTYLDSITGLPHTRDFNQILRDRDYYLISKMETAYTASLAQYYENTVNLNNASLYSVSFPGIFSQTPIVTLFADPTTFPPGFVIPYLTAVTVSGFTFGLSAPATGTLVYKAVNLIKGTYPCTVTRAPLFPSTTGQVSAGSVSLVASTNVTMSFAPVAGSTSLSNFSYTTQDTGNLDADVYLLDTSFSSGNSTAEISAPFTGTVNFILVK
jgi:hypothetical protein